MIQLIRFSLLFLSLFIFVSSLSVVFDAWDYEWQDPNVRNLLHTNITPDELNKRIGHAINDNNLEDAKAYLAIARSYDYPMHYDYYESHIKRLDTPMRQLKLNITDFADGFVSGKSDSSVGVAGAVAADFTVVGDVRDLYKQYQLNEAGKAVDELIIGLSGVGVGLTLATYGSLGITAPVKAGTSMMKAAKKMRYLSRGFSGVVTRSAKRVFDWPLFSQSLRQSNSIGDVSRSAKKAFNAAEMGAIKGMANHVSSMSKASSVGDTLVLLKHVETADDLRRLDKFVGQHKHMSKGLMTLLGKSAIRSVKVVKRSAQLLLGIFGSFFSFMFTLLFILSGGGASKKKPKKAANDQEGSLAA